MDASHRYLHGTLNIPHKGHDDVLSESSQWLAWAAYDENWMAGLKRNESIKIEHKEYLKMVANETQNFLGSFTT
jgi:hypothetical protein